MTTRSAQLRLVFYLTILLGACASRMPPTGATAPRPAPAVEKPASIPPPPAKEPSLPAPKGALGALDQLFLDAYVAAAKSAKTLPHPVVVVSGSSLILHVPSEKSQTVRVIPDIYHALKAVSHFAFAAYLRLKTPAPDSEPIQLLLAREPPARQHLAEFALTPEQMKRQHAILTATTSLLRESVSASVAPARLQQYAREMGPLLLENTRDAGCAQVEGTHRQMLKWRAAHPQQNWSRVVVVNRSGHQARYRNAATTYFHWLLGGGAPPWSYPGESMRVIYAESLFGGDEPLDLFATVVIDAQASRDFFGDEWRLSEDVLSEGAAWCTAKLPESERWSR